MGPREPHALGTALPDDVHQGSDEWLHLVVEAVLGTQRLDQRGHPAVVVPRHSGEEAGERGWHEPEVEPLSSSPRLLGPASPRPSVEHSLVLNLEVEVSTEPIVEG